MRYIAVVVVGAVTALCVAGLPAGAQSPVPSNYFTDWRPGNAHYGSNGLIVEGLGMLGCSYSLASVEADTVADINSGHATLTEISPQNGCISGGNQHIGQYEAAIDSLATYVDAHAANAGNLWGGVVLDEEPGFGLDLTHLYALNQYTNNRMLSTAGLSFWLTDLGNSPGYWTQGQYNALTVGSYNGVNYAGFAAPQVYNSFQAGNANGSGLNYQLVTTWTGASAPYNSASYAASRISGSPFNSTFGTSHTFNWEWTWTPQ